MRAHTRHLVVALAVGMGAASADARTVTMQTHAASVARFDYLEVTLEVTDPVATNVFWDATVSATFNKVGEAAIALDGFCDAADGTVYRVRFCPREIGDYEFAIAFTDGAGTEDFGGTFACVAGTLPGFLRIDPAHPMHFIREGTGNHFYAIGNTVYGMLGLTDMGTITDAIDHYKAKGINRLRFNNFAYFNDGEFGASFDATWNGTLNAFDGSDYSRYDLAQWQKMEQILLHMRGQDVIASVIMVIDRGKNNFPSAGSTNEDRYYRYAVARYAAFSNVTFDLGNEHNEYRSVPAWANRLGALVMGWNPYDNLVSAHAYADHVYKNDPPDTDWCGWQEFQQYGTASENNAHIIANRDAPQPLINEEYGYEGDNAGTDGHQQDYVKVRHDVWAIALGGGYATYGDWHDGAFVTGKVGTGTALADGYFNHLRTFFADKQYWLLEPDNTLVTSGYCLTRAGYEYVVYVESGGSFDVDLSAADGAATLTATWMNPSTGATQSGASASGGAARTFTTPDGADWVLYLAVETDGTPPSTPGAPTAVATDARHVQLTWTAATDGESGIDGYRVYRSTSGGAFTLLVELGDVLTYEDATAQPSTDYAYEISAVNGAGAEGAHSAEGSVTTPAGNASPVGDDASLAAVEDTDTPFTLSATDAEGDAITTWRIETAPTNGTIVGFDAGAGTGTYRPEADATGADGFAFSASDDGGTNFGTAGTVTVTIAAVNDPPVALDASTQTTPGTQALTHLLIEDPDGPGPFLYTVTVQPAHGTLSGPTNDLKYTPDVGFTGQDSFTWIVNDGLVDSQPAVYVIDVAAVHLKINCGDNGHDVAGWERDDAYVQDGEDYVFATGFDVTGVTNAAPAEVYRSVRHLSPHSYSFAVPDGSYTLRLHLGDSHGGDRAMDYTVEGTLRITGLDVDDEAGSLTTPLVVDLDVTVADGDGLQILCEEGAGTDVFEGGIEVIGGGASAGAPEIEVYGRGVEISDGQTATRYADGTAFGSVIVGGTATRTFTIRNAGTAPLSVSGVTLSGGGAASFLVSSPSPASVPANASGTFTVSFTAAATGAAACVVEVASDDADENPFTFAVAGDGVATASEDTDLDGLDDAWETSEFGDLSRDGSGDADDDGLSDLDEYLLGTDPNVADTDGDGASDADEVDAGTNPVDPVVEAEGGGATCAARRTRGAAAGLAFCVSMTVAACLLRRRRDRRSIQTSAARNLSAEIVRTPDGRSMLSTPPCRVTTNRAVTPRRSQK